MSEQSYVNVVEQEPRPGRIRFSLRSLLSVLTMCALLLYGCVWVGKKWDEWSYRFFIGYEGEVANWEDGPEPLKDLIATAEKNGLELEGLRIHCFGDALSREYVWKMKFSPELRELTIAQLRLKPQPQTHRSIFLARHPVNREPGLHWWELPEPDQCVFYANSGFLNWDEDDHFQVAVDENYGLIYVYYYWDF